MAEFTVLTDHVRKAVDERLAAQIEVTGWSGGVLRIRLAQPALATHWRFQEPAVRRHLSRLPAFRSLQEIRLVLAAPAARMRPAPPSRPIGAPVGALRALAADEPHVRLRRALEELAAAAEASSRDNQ
ncbi:MAG: DciA family protein [Pseudomonadota bacterium]